jgi:TPR repeat protein
MLGVMYDGGKGVTPNYQQAATWYGLAAIQGNTRSQAGLGFLYEKGLGVPQNYIRAHMWLSLAAAAETGEIAKTLAYLRDEVAKKMSPVQIAQAQEMARQCRESGHGRTRLRDCFVGEGEPLEASETPTFLGFRRTASVCTRPKVHLGNPFKWRWR